MTCAKLWHDQIIIFQVRATHILSKFGQWADKWFANGYLSRYEITEYQIALTKITWNPRVNSIKMLYHQHRNSHFGDKMIWWLSYLHNRISYTILVKLHHYIESGPRENTLLKAFSNTLSLIKYFVFLFKFEWLLFYMHTSWGVVYSCTTSHYFRQNCNKDSV